MYAILLVVHLLIAAGLVGVVLLQRSEGGALGMGGGGGGSFLTGRGTANLLTRTTTVLAVLFFVTSLALVKLSSGEPRGRSILDAPVPATSEVPAPVSEAPAVPAPPAEPTAPIAR